MTRKSQTGRNDVQRDAYNPKGSNDRAKFRRYCQSFGMYSAEYIYVRDRRAQNTYPQNDWCGCYHPRLAIHDPTTISLSKVR